MNFKISLFEILGYFIPGFLVVISFVYFLYQWIPDTRSTIFNSSIMWVWAVIGFVVGHIMQSISSKAGNLTTDRVNLHLAEQYQIFTGATKEIVPNKQMQQKYDMIKLPDKILELFDQWKEQYIGNVTTKLSSDIVDNVYPHRHAMNYAFNFLKCDKAMDRLEHLRVLVFLFRGLYVSLLISSIFVLFSILPFLICELSGCSKFLMWLLAVCLLVFVLRGINSIGKSYWQNQNYLIKECLVFIAFDQVTSEQSSNSHPC